MVKTFKDLVICSTNDHHSSKNDKLKGWIEHNGGRFCRDLNLDVTHLVSSTRAALDKTRRHPLVKEARDKNIAVVSLDWVEESLMRPNRKALKAAKFDFFANHLKKTKIRRRQARVEMARPETSLPDVRGDRRKHVLDSIEKPEKTGKAKLVDHFGANFDEAVKAYVTKMGNDGWKLYSEDGFTYSVLLVRPDILKAGLEKHTLKVRYHACFCLASRHHPCPLPLYHIPEPSPFSSYPAISAKLPNRMNWNSSKTIRVHISNRWAQCLQMFENDSYPPKYKAVSLTMTKEGVLKEEIVAALEGHDLAMDLWKLRFKARTGKGWGAKPVPVESARKRKHNQADGANEDAILTYVLEDNDMNGQWWRTKRAKTGRSRSLPAVTVMVQDVDAAESLHARAATPEGGW